MENFYQLAPYEMSEHAIHRLNPISVLSDLSFPMFT